MSDNIIVELNFLLQSFIGGIIVMAVYDILRIFRRIVKHNTVAVAFEDIVYWILIAIGIFSKLIMKNDGIIRAFSLISIFLGILIYFCTISKYVIKYTVSIIKFIIKLITKATGVVTKPFRKKS